VRNLSSGKRNTSNIAIVLFNYNEFRTQELM
jgi:hypothetical protein